LLLQNQHRKLPHQRLNRSQWPSHQLPQSPNQQESYQPVRQTVQRNNSRKLLESNKRLYEANELLRQEMVKRNQSNQTFAPIQQPAAPPVPQAPGQQTPVRQPDPKDFIETDPQTGERYINESRLQTAFDELRKEATQANTTVQQYIQTAEQREVDRQNREAFNSYPELNPQSDTFNYGFHQQVRGILYDSMINSHEYKGKALSFKEAADFVKSQYPAAQPAPVPAPAPAVTPEHAQAQQTLKEQASSSATGQPPAQARQSYSEDADLQNLRMQTRRGSDEALAQRLVHTPHILTPDAQQV
jgi:hypothetical protein